MKLDLGRLRDMARREAEKGRVWATEVHEASRHEASYYAHGFQDGWLKLLALLEKEGMVK